MTSLDLLGPRNLLFSWLAAAAALPGVMLVVVVGQGLGSLLGGCAWIGLSVPVHRPPWALVNQPSLAFAGQAGANGYWLGSTLLPLVLVLVAMIAVRRPRRLAVELVLIQWCWALTVVGLAWLPLLDGEDGHVARFLHFKEAAPWLAWLLPLAAVSLGVLPALRLLSSLRLARRSAGRAARELALILHLMVPTLTFLAAVTILRGSPALEPSLAAALVIVAPLVVAWLRFPLAPFQRPDEVSVGHAALALAVVLGVAGVIWVGGRPLTTDTVAGVTWSVPAANNNIRPWIEDRPLAEAVVAALPGR